MLTKNQVRYLRGLAHSLHPIFQVGKAGIGPNMIEQLSSTLEARELLKVSVLNNCPEEPQTVGQALADSLDAELVQVIGRVVVLYRVSRERKQIELPR